jgi:hypothetical protein
MPITTIQPASANQRPTVAPRQNQDPRFAALMHHYGLPASGPSAPPDEAPAKAASPPSTAPTAPDTLIPLGEINAETPTVSHLLINHPELRQECWKIVHAKVNQEKEFTAMQPGTAVSLNPSTKELVWTQQPSANKPAITADKPLSADTPINSATDGQHVLGTIKPDTPTISHLLKSDPRYTDNAWSIIFSNANRSKPFASLEPGSVVAINPQTLELSFQNNDALVTQPAISTEPSPPAIAAEAPPPKPVENAEDPTEQSNFAQKLVGSVKSYLGQSYDKLDCYGLVVRGLKDLGIQYNGANGLRQRLDRLAQEQGLAKNAYENGEGLIEVAGNKVYGESFVRVKDADRQSAEVMKKLEPLLQEGMLLSFSTESHGHTGVIAKKGNQWTYVNSGLIDHDVNGGGKVSRRVGEETLADEIKNWFVLAKNNTSSLKVSAGLFDAQKLQSKTGVVANTRPKGQDMI